jgi:hypothetical protein
VAKAKNRDGDTYSYKGWLVSDRFYRRALAVTGYHLATVGFIYGVLLALFLLLLAIVGLVRFLI